MQPTALITALTRTRDADRLARAEVLRSLTGAGPTPAPRTAREVTIRFARRGDERRLQKLAELDERRGEWAASKAENVLVAEVGGELVAARPVDGGPVIADPFRSTADLVAILNVRAEQMSGPRERGIFLPALRPRTH